MKLDNYAPTLGTCELRVDSACSYHGREDSQIEMKGLAVALISRAEYHRGFKSTLQSDLALLSDCLLIHDVSMLSRPLDRRYPK
eukprot:431017-Pyramimonas_sp.AAC.1